MNGQLCVLICTSGKEPWLANSLVEYYYSTRSDRAKEIVVQIREPLDKVGGYGSSVEKEIVQIREPLDKVGGYGFISVLLSQGHFFVCLSLSSWIHKHSLEHYAY